MSSKELIETSVEALSSPTKQIEPKSPTQRDWFLLEFVRLAEIGVEQSITLSVGGSLVTGVVISGFKFFELMSEEIKRAKLSATGDTAIYDNLTQNYLFFRDMVKDNSSDAGQPVPVRDYIHLRDARVLLGSSSVPTRGGVLWRGRVQSVDAFFSGSISST